MESCSQTLWQEPWTKKACLQFTANRSLNDRALTSEQLTWHVLAKTVAGTLNGSLSSQIVNKIQFLKTGKFFIWHNQTSVALLSSTRPPRHGLPQLKSGGNFFSQYHQSQLRCGISYRAFSARAMLFEAWIQWLALSIRRWQRTPNQWQHSMSFQLDTQNNNPGCQGIRLVSCLDPCGAAYYKILQALMETVPSLQPQTLCCRILQAKVSPGTDMPTKCRITPAAKPENFTRMLFFDVQNAFRVRFCR